MNSKEKEVVFVGVDVSKDTLDVYTPEVQGKGIEGSNRGMYAKADNDPKPNDQDRPGMDNKMSVLSCPQNALDDFPSARLSLVRLCPRPKNARLDDTLATAAERLE